MSIAHNLFATVCLSLLLTTAAVGISGCLTLDGLLASGHHEEQAYDPEDKQPWFIGDDGELTKETVGADGVPNPAYMVSVPNAEPNGAVKAGSSFASTFGPWGAVAGTTIVGAVTVYLKWRRAKLLGLDLEAADALNVFLVSLIEKVKTGSKDLLDAGVLTFVDGKFVLNQDAFKEWLRKQGKQFSDPAYLAEVVRQVTEAL